MLRTFAIICAWKSAKDPSYTQVKIELFYGIWVFLLEAVWLIYGNTFIYNDTIKDCNTSFQHKWSFKTLNTNTLRATAMVLIIYGYFLLIGIILVILFYAGAYFGYKSYVKQDLASKEVNQPVDSTSVM